MATRKTIKTLFINGKPVTPSGDASIPVFNNSWEGMDNLDDSIDWKYNAEKESATFPVVLDDATRKHLIETNKVPGWLISATFRDNTSLSMSNCGFQSIPSLDGDGVVELEVKGVVTWL